jgi:UDP-N-acetylglucosamine diphosphorylase / glucose-1-phosphate thymidylyltransferase / UDP-N-acetylgalactosamine diphosphorylase / glucosamine-1-phosphate N-acetyltransferase / galactosamine-1-phosphate N-acetyltransferase
MKVVFHDDATARGFEPFALTRPISTLVAGVMPIGSRWEVLGAESDGFLGADHLGDFELGGFAEAAEPKQGTVIANSRFAPSLGAKFDDKADVWASAGRVVAVRLARGLRAADIRAGNIPLESLAKSAAHMAEIEGWWMGEVWDFLRHLPEMLASDLMHIARSASKKTAPPSHATVIGTNPVMIFDAEVEPHVVFDTTGGPIFVDRGAHIHAFTRVAGPCYIGSEATILGGDILACSIGPVSKIRGEISGSVVLGYSNKGHEGFVGSSYVGQWVNLGAGTTTSNLKNTYGPVALWTPTGVRGTGMQFLGTLFGDHVKTGIGTMLNTGTVLGAGANVFGTKMPPKAVAPFSWGEGEPYDLYRLDKFLASAEKVMARRKVTLTEKMKKQLSASFEQRWSVK